MAFDPKYYYNFSGSGSGSDSDEDFSSDYDDLDELLDDFLDKASLLVRLEPTSDVFDKYLAQCTSEGYFPVNSDNNAMSIKEIINCINNGYYFERQWDRKIILHDESDFPELVTPYNFIGTFMSVF